MTVKAEAPAKVNLTLHVTGRRADGYHLLDSLVAFAPGISDRIEVSRAKATRLSVTGPFAEAVPTGPDNLVLRAAALLDAPASITLEKNLPVAAGIGGGSSDAAAVLRALGELYDLVLPSGDVLLALGADVPVCLVPGLQRMRGIGEDLDPLGGQFEWPMVLANPGVAVATGEVFAKLEGSDNPPMSEPLYDPAYFEFPDWLATQRNDLEVPACAIAPVIGDLLNALRAEPGCRIARMSGSGPTCFALFDTTADAREAADTLHEAHPDWWVKST